MKRIVSLILAVMMCFPLLSGAGLSGGKVYAAEPGTVYDGTFAQSVARPVADMVNEFRLGSEAWFWNSDDETKTEYNVEGGTYLDGLVYDYDLERIAMQRAVEIAISFSHTRPDGSRCFTCTYNGSRSYGENIAYGYSSASSVMTAWKETDENYAGQGHRRNMLQSGFKSIGVACFIYNGRKYWVQEFSYYVYNTNPTEACNDDVTYVMDESGNVTVNYGSPVPTGWQTEDGKTYYYDENGNKVTGWLDLAGKRYFLRSNGALATGLFKVSGKYYYAGADGAICYGLVSIGGVNYYFDTTTGARVSNKIVTLDDGKYFFGSEGEMVYGKVLYSGSYYYFTNNTEEAEHPGRMITGDWVTENGNTYYYRSNGKMATGLFKVKGKYYFFLKDGENIGAMVTSTWMEDEGGRRFFQSNGRMVIGFKKISGQYYFFDQNGMMETNTWEEVGGYMYYFRENGRAAKNMTLTIDGVEYSFDAEGHLENGPED